MLIQKFLETHSLSDLESVGIDYNLFDNGKIVQLNYNQITAQESDPMSRQCRALILSVPSPITEINVVGQTAIVSRSFDRFFNLGQQNTTLDFSKKITIFEKLDGSMINVYHYNNKWYVSTRSCWDGSNEVNGFVFKDLFLKCLKIPFDEFTAKLDPKYTWIFELIPPVNRIVVNYPDFSLIFIGCREIQTGIEKDIHQIDIDISIPNIYNFNSVEDILNFIKQLKDHHFEGFVAVDENFNRVKIKSPKYLIAHRVATLTTCDHHLMDMILQKIDDDMVQYLAEYFKERLFNIKIKFNEYLVLSDSIFHQFKDLSRKEFALAIMERKNILTQHLFNQYTGKAVSTLDSIEKQKKSGEFPRSVLDSILGVLDLAKANA